MIGSHRRHLRNRSENGCFALGHIDNTDFFLVLYVLLTPLVGCSAAASIEPKKEARDRS